MDALMLDGNSVAGLLQEIFAVEMTTAAGTCNGCGAVEAVGAVRVYQGAGIVLRCPHCDNRTRQDRQGRRTGVDRPARSANAGARLV